MASVAAFATALVGSAMLPAWAAVSSAAERPAADMAVLKKWNQPLPALALKDLQGSARNLREWRGKVLVVHFWATWCEPCVAEMPTLMRLKTEMRDQPFEVVTVNLGEVDTRIKNFYQKLDLDFVTLLDRDGDAKKAWRVGGVPMSFVVGADGRPRYRYFGEIDWTSDDVRAKFAVLMREVKRSKRADAIPTSPVAPRGNG